MALGVDRPRVLASEQGGCAVGAVHQIQSRLGATTALVSVWNAMSEFHRLRAYLERRGAFTEDDFAFLEPLFLPRVSSSSAPATA